MRSPSSRGFTIIELMVVMVIAGVLLVIAAPSFRDMMDRRRLEGQANEFVIDLGYAKSEAVQRNRNVLLMTGSTGACYAIVAWTDSAARTGSCNCANTPVCSTTGLVTDPAELKTVALQGLVTVSANRTFDFEPVRGALAPATAASAAVVLNSRSLAVSVGANGRVAPFAP